MTLPYSAHIETVSVHAGREADTSAAALSPPLHLSTTFVREADGSFPHGYTYSRAGNPNRAALETCLAGLEAGCDAMAFSSGTAAAMTVFQALNPGDHVICSRDAYHGVLRLLREVLMPWQLKVSFVDASKTEIGRASCRERV